MMKRFLSILTPLLLVPLLTACVQQPQAPTPGPSPTAPVLAEAATATLSPATATDAPTASPSPVPPDTPAPTATATATASATATTAPLLLLDADDFGADRNPLTGEQVSDPAVLQRRPIAVKISNAPPGFVRPQSGPNQADLVFEHIAEFGVTRFTAIFYDELPPDVGPIRSGRLIDVELPAMYDAAFSYSGASVGVNQKLWASDFAQRILPNRPPGHYRTGADKPYEHTLYGTPALWIEELAEQGLNVPPQFANYMAFSEAPPAGGQPVSRIVLDYPSTTAEWRYDSASNRYLRWSDGVTHHDANTGEQLSATNVAVVYAPHVLDLNICEHIRAGDTECAAFSVEIQIWGQGPARIFRDGQMYEATWKREQRADMLTFYDAAGNPLPLQIGNTWFQMAPSNEADILTVES